MRLLLFVFVFSLSISAAAQSPVVSKLYSEGTAYANGRNYDQALKSYTAALRTAESEYVSDAYRAKLYYNIGVCQFQLGEFELAAGRFKSAVLLKKDYVQAHEALGLTNARLREWKSASTMAKRGSM